MDDMVEAVRESWWKRLCGGKTARDRRNQRQVVLAALGWAVTLVGCQYLISADLLPEGPVLWLVAALPAAVAVATVIVFVRYLRETDELQRAIQLQALALGVGAGFVAWSAHTLLEDAGAPIGDWPAVYLVVVIFYVVGYLLASRRYR